MGFGDFLRGIIIYITYFLIWQIARWGVLPDIKLFIDDAKPRPVWATLYAIFLQIAIFIFWFGVLLIAFLFCVYLFVVLILRFIAIPFGAIIAEILLNITPLKDMRDLGLIDLVKSLLEIVFSLKPLGQRFVDFWRALINFLLIATGLRRKIDKRKEEIEKNKNSENSTQNSGDNEDSNMTDENNEEPTPNDENNKYEDVSPPLDIGGNTDEERLVQANYEKCYLENYIPLTDDMSSWEKLKTSQKNSINSSKCGIQLMKDKTKIESMNKYKD